MCPLRAVPGGAAAPPPLEDQDAPYVGDVDGEGCGVCLSASPECAALFLAASHPLDQHASPLN